MGGRGRGMMNQQQFGGRGPPRGFGR